MPGTLLSSATVTGLGSSEVVLGMDKRPANGTIYLLTADSGAGRFLRTVDPGSGATSYALALGADPTDATAPYSGFDPSQGVGFDVDPRFDRLRIVTGGRANMRVNPDTVAVTTDDAINPGTPQLVASAYLNNLPGASATTLYGYDLSGNKLVIQNPPNNGTVTTIGTNSGITAGAASDVGFDIFTTSNGSTNTNTAFLSTNNSLYTVDLTAGTASLVGAIGSGSLPIRDITAAENLIGLTSASVDRSEAAGSVQLTLQRLNPRGSASVRYSTGDGIALEGSAVAGSDYTGSSEIVSFADGETTKTIAVPITDDRTTEPTESFIVWLSNPTAINGTAVVFGGSTSVNIIDNDPDLDGDGVPDAVDNCPNVSNAAQIDRNGNGLGTACDPSEPSVTKANFARAFVQTLAGKLVTFRTRLAPASDRSLALLTIACRAHTSCTARYKLFLGKPIGAAGKRTVPPGQARSVIVRLTRRGLATLRRKGRMTSRLSLRLADRSGHARTDVVKLALKRS